MSPDEETEALRRLLTSFIENKQIIHLYVKRALQNPAKLLFWNSLSSYLSWDFS